MRKGRKHAQGKLKNAAGELVSSECRAATFASYLETIQWAVRPATLVDATPIFDTLQVNVNEITMQELHRAIRLFKCGKATGPDDVPVEYLEDSIRLRWSWFRVVVAVV